jgi:hypothetical protein
MECYRGPYGLLNESSQLTRALALVLAPFVTSIIDISSVFSRSTCILHQLCYLRWSTEYSPGPVLRSKESVHAIIMLPTLQWRRARDRGQAVGPAEKQGTDVVTGNRTARGVSD